MSSSAAIHRGQVAETEFDQYQLAVLWTHQRQNVEHVMAKDEPAGLAGSLSELPAKDKRPSSARVFNPWITQGQDRLRTARAAAGMTGSHDPARPRRNAETVESRTKGTARSITGARPDRRGLRGDRS